MKTVTDPPIVSIVGTSGVGKTTILEKLIPELTRRGLRVGTVKHHAHGEFEMDRPGKDSWRHKKAGAATSIVSSPQRIGILMDVDHDHKPNELKSLFSNIDIILTEGYKREDNPKIEVFRSEINGEPVCKGDKHLLALVSDESVDLGIPRYSTDDIEGLADFLITGFTLVSNQTTHNLKAAS
ncbi:MAG: molybdopterin-guanine dinucleotide biosynthesis protein B [Thermodesulfobacteriota bacterium]|nr:molybdopterin-guanine dinucleotide biosynthesis protein B [Thermodesulfobacteriota bacterium]